VHTTGNKSHPFSTREAFSLFVFSLACLFDSLVRVSRRVEGSHFHLVFANIESVPGKRPNCWTRRGLLTTYRGSDDRFPTPLVSPSPASALLLHIHGDLTVRGRANATGLVLAIKWRYFHYRCRDFRCYVTLFPKYFSNFRSRYLFAIGLPTLYLTLAGKYLPLYTALPSSATHSC
jgi:hypothetical protein